MKNTLCKVLEVGPDGTSVLLEKKREVMGQIWFSAESEKCSGEYQTNTGKNIR